MGRPVPRPRKIDGRVPFKTPDGFFLAALDIKDLIPLRVRIAEVVEYPAGTPRGGFASKEAFTAILLDVRGKKSGEWKRGSKPWAPNTTALWALFNRFGEESAWWVGQEITLDLTPRRNPNGGGVVAGIYVVPIEDERTEEQVAAKMARALHGECPYNPDARTEALLEKAPLVERQPGEDDEPPPSDEDTDTTEPPDGWKPGEQP
jgi:hypothetical protein